MKTIKEVPEKNLCTGCGTCIGVCPTDALCLHRTPNGVYVPSINLQKCVECKLCVRVCPGYVLDILRLSNYIFGKKPEDLLLGNYIECYVGHSTDERVRYESASGGIATSLLLFLVEQGIINGALVTQMSAKNPLEPEVFIARTGDEIIAASKSKYCPVPLNSVLKRVTSDDKLAVVGLPCHIRGIRKAELVKTEFKDRIILKIGLFCGHTVNFYGTTFLLQRAGINIDDVVKLDYRGKGWPGGMTITLRDGSERFIQSRIYWRYFFAPFFFTPIRCTFCNDLTNELADISLGDAWLPELRENNAGESIIIIRTLLGMEIMQKAVANGKLKVRKINRNKVIQSQRSMLLFKKRRLGSRMSLMRMLGKEVPEINEKILKGSWINYLSGLLVYLNIHLSSRRGFRRLLKNIPLSILKLYSIVLGVVSRLEQK